MLPLGIGRAFPANAPPTPPLPGRERSLVIVICKRWARALVGHVSDPMRGSAPRAHLHVLGRQLGLSWPLLHRSVHAEAAAAAHLAPVAAVVLVAVVPAAIPLLLLLLPPLLHLALLLLLEAVAQAATPRARDGHLLPLLLLARSNDLPPAATALLALLLLVVVVVVPTGPAPALDDNLAASLALLDRDASGGCLLAPSTLLGGNALQTSLVCQLGLAVRSAPLQLAQHLQQGRQRELERKRLLGAMHRLAPTLAARPFFWTATAWAPAEALRPLRCAFFPCCGACSCCGAFFFFPCCCCGGWLLPAPLFPAWRRNEGRISRRAHKPS